MGTRGPRIPIHGFVEGDVLGVLVLADAGGRVADLAEQILQAAAPRVAPFASPVVRFRGAALDAKHTLEQSGLAPLSVVHVGHPGGRHGV